MLSGMVGAALRASHIGWYLRMVAPPIREEKERGGGAFRKASCLDLRAITGSHIS